MFGDVPVDFQQKASWKFSTRRQENIVSLRTTFWKIFRYTVQKYEGDFPEIDRLNGLPENEKSPKDWKQIVNYAVMTYIFNGEPKENAARVKVLAVEDRPLVMVKKKSLPGRH